MSEIGTYVDLNYLNGCSRVEQPVQHKWYRPGTYVPFIKYTESIAKII